MTRVIVPPPAAQACRTFSKALRKKRVLPMRMQSRAMEITSNTQLSIAAELRGGQMGTAPGKRTHLRPMVPSPTT